MFIEREVFSFWSLVFGGGRGSFKVLVGQMVTMLYNLIGLCRVVASSIAKDLP